MKGNCYSPSTTLEQGELLARPLQYAQKSAKAHIETEAKHKRFSPDKHHCIGVIPFGVTEETINTSIQNEINFYHSGKEIARWLVKKSEYNKQ